MTTGRPVGRLRKRMGRDSVVVERPGGGVVAARRLVGRLGMVRCLGNCPGREPHPEPHPEGHPGLHPEREAQSWGRRYRGEEG